MVRAIGRVVGGLIAAAALLALLAGLPWALVRLVGWPLPDHVPTWEEVEATLLNPMSAQFLLDCLAVMCWILWFVFALDVLRCAVDVARGIAWPHARAPGPLHGLAAALIGAVVLTLLGSRTAYTTAPSSTSQTSDHSLVAASAPLTPGRVPHSAAVVVPTVDRAAPAPPGMVRVTDEVRLPQDGIYDSLWRIAERIYGPGGGSRWPDLFQLNRGVEQPDGRALSNPNLVRPGWKIIAYVPAPNELPNEPAPPAQSPPPTSTEPTQPSSPSPAPRKNGEQRADQSGSGLNLMTGAFVSVGLAAAVTAAVVSARMRRRRRYRIGSGDRTDLRRPIAPVVRALRAADQRDEDDRQVVDDVELVLGSDDQREPVVVRAGVRGDRELAVSLAGTHGLGLAGSGATAAARALLLHLLAQRHGHADDIRVIVPVADLHHVFDGVDVDNTPSSVLVVDSLDAALDEMEAALLTRTRRVAEENITPTALGPLVLLASPAPHAERRLQAVLDNGSVFGMAGILLGQWRPGATVLVRDDGTVRAASPGLGDALTGTRLFSLPAADTNDLLAVLREAEGSADEPPTQVEPAWPLVGEADRPGSDLEDASLRRRTDHDERSDTEPSRPRLSVNVMGRVQVTRHDANGDQEIGGALTPKQREVLVFLALHPEGVRREVLNEAVWPNSRPPRPYNSFHNTLSTLRRALSDATGVPSFVLNEDGRYRLNNELVDVDFWALQQALQAPPDADARNRLLGAIERYQGDLAEDVTAAWAEPIRESVRRDVLDALGGLVRVASDNAPEKALALLERARQLDQYNEGVYTALIRLQARLGRYDAIPRTVALLTTTLNEIGERPSNDILNLADFLQRRGNTRRPPSGNAAAS